MGSREKRSKKASKGRKKKVDGRKKSAKKLLRHEDSYSESDDESLSLVSSSSYSAEEVVKGRLSRSRARKDVKGRKKRARSSSCSSDGSSDSGLVKKRKSSKRKVGLGRKKKDGKKYKRAASFDSENSDDSDYKKSRGESKKKGIRRRYDKQEKSKRKKKRNRARSISPSNESSASDIERKRKRYRSPSGSSSSMISASERGEKKKRYWSPSDSSLSRGSKSSYQDELEVQNIPNRKLKSIIVVASSAEPDAYTMSTVQNNDLDIRGDDFGTKSSSVEKVDYIEEKRSATEALAPVPDIEDLETILRRKALENLKKFRGPKMSEKSEKKEMSVTGIKQLPNSENAADQENTNGGDRKHCLSSEGGAVKDFDKDQVLGVNLESSSEKEEILANPHVYNHNTSFKIYDETKKGGTQSIQFSDDNRVMTSKADKSNQTTVADKNFSGVDRSMPIKLPNVEAKSDSMLASQEPLTPCSTKRLKSSPIECINAADKSSNTQADKVITNSVVNTIKEGRIVNSAIPHNPSSSLPDSVAGNQASSELQKEDSQFQEKTMTVMRGGELVQVSYKVYIPKKAPAANRRRLNR